MSCGITSILPLIFSDSTPNITDINLLIASDIPQH